MSLFNIFHITGSAMRAQNIRLNLTASNLANADTVASTEKDVYRARHPIFSSVLSRIPGTGHSAVTVKTLSIMENQREAPKRYEPGNPYANAEGYIYGSNVDTVEEMTNMINASRSYQTNVEVLNASKKLLLETLKIGQ